MFRYLKYVLLCKYTCKGYVIVKGLPSSITIQTIAHWIENQDKFNINVTLTKRFKNIALFCFVFSSINSAHFLKIGMHQKLTLEQSCRKKKLLSTKVYRYLNVDLFHRMNFKIRNENK